MNREKKVQLQDLAREALGSALPRSWRVEEVRPIGAGGWRVELTHLRSDRSLVIELTTRTLDDAVRAARSLIGAAGIADALPASTAVVISVRPETDLAGANEAP